MDTPLSQDPMSAGWVLACGTIIVGATLKLAADRIAKSPMAMAPKRPSLVTTMIAGVLLRNAVGRLGNDALGHPPDRPQ
ncbi:MAG: hypothetical protein QOH62_1657 [Solirubrobacteraceae bacterium]|jgi:hypothetical protein|nr:hypothetical protein [Solirubrobacteraceae bacterium]